MEQEILKQSNLSGDRGVWAAIAVICDMVRTEGTSSPRAINKLKQALKDEPVSAPLRLLAALEIARVTKETHLLDAMDQNPFTEAEVAKVKYDIVRNLAYSKLLRDKVHKDNPLWSAYVKEELADLEQPNIFSLVPENLPPAGKEQPPTNAAAAVSPPANPAK
jgi:hypothetical protein